MPKTSWPYVDAPTSDVQYATLFRLFQLNGVVADINSDALQVYADSTGMTVKVKAGDAFIRGYYFQNTDGATSLSIEAATSTARVDRIVLRLNVADSNVANRIKLAVLKGTNLTPPALTQVAGGVWEESIALVTVGSNVPNIAAGAVDDDRGFCGTPMGRWVDDDHRPANPLEYQIGYNESRNELEFFITEDWAPLPVDWTSIASKPSTFPPAAHTHSWNAIADKPSTFPPSSHTHTTSQISDFPGQHQTQLYSGGSGASSGGIVSGGDSKQLHSVNVTVPAGKVGTAHIGAKIYIFSGNVTWAASMTVYLDGKVIDAYRYHNHGKGGPYTPTAYFTLDLPAGAHTIAVKWNGESASGSTEFWDTEVQVAVLWAS